MTLPDIDTLTTAGGGLQDYTAVIDPTTDRPAAGANTAYANEAMATHTQVRALIRFVPNGTSAPTLAATGFQWDSVWKAA